MTLLPPANGQESDEDGGEEEGVDFNNLSRNQLIAEAEVEIDYGNHMESTIDDIENELSRDLWADEVVQSEQPIVVPFEAPVVVSPEALAVPTPEVPDSVNRWLSVQLPPEPPSSWEKKDLPTGVEFSDPPQVNQTCSIDQVTPFGLFNAFFDDAVINHIVEMTNLYARRDKSMVNFCTDKCEIRTFLAILLLSGFNTRPRIRMYWESSPLVHCEAVANAMSRNRFKELMSCFHLCDNMSLNNSDKMTKVRPFFNMMNERCLKFRANLPNLSVDEAMLPYFGRNSSKQRIQNKPVRLGYKMWVLAEDSGYIVQFSPYQGAKSDGPQRSSPTSWGLGEKTVLELLECMPQGPSYHVFVDNFFTSVRLTKFLKQNNIKASGTLRQNRIPKSCTIARKSDLWKEERGKTSQETATDDSTTIVGWKDNKVVFFTTNADATSPEVMVKRYSREERQRVAVKQPNSIHKYNLSMGGVDRADQNVSQYLIGIRSKKWWWALFAWVPDVIVQNCWILYRKYKSPTDPTYDLLGFRREIVDVYLAQFSNSAYNPVPRPTKRPKLVSSDIRFDRKDHFSVPCATTKRCGYCGKNTRKWCVKCQKGLHDRCFNSFHGFGPNA